MQGCGSVLATRNLDTISFEWSTQQRCSTSQAFTKPRLIARPVHAQHGQHPQHAQHAQHPQRAHHAQHAQHLPRSGTADKQLPETCHEAKPAAEFAQQCNAIGPAAPDRQHIEPMHGISHQAECVNGAEPFGADFGRNSAAGDSASGSSGSPCGKQMEGLHAGMSTFLQASEDIHSDSGLCIRNQPMCTDVSAHSGCDIDSVEQANLQEAGCESEVATDDHQGEAAALLCWLEGLQLRYFTPREVANLHTFPDSFSFPAHVTRRQQYALLGNSLSVAVVAELLTYMLKMKT